MTTLLLLLSALLVIGVIVWQRRQADRHRRLLVRQLRSWLGAQESLDPDLLRWINSLSSSEADVLLTLLTGYCTSLNWELRWLFTPELQKVPILQQAMTEGITAYACSILASLQLVEDVHAYQAYVRLRRKPTQRQQFALVQKLYQTLGEQRVLTPLPPKRRWFRRQPTRKQQIAAVLAAFDQDPAAAMTTLKTVLAQTATADVQAITNVMAHPVRSAPIGAAA